MCYGAEMYLHNRNVHRRRFGTLQNVRKVCRVAFAARPSVQRECHRRLVCRQRETVVWQPEPGSDTYHGVTSKYLWGDSQRRIGHRRDSHVRPVILLRQRLSFQEVFGFFRGSGHARLVLDLFRIALQSRFSLNGNIGRLRR